MPPEKSMFGNRGFCSCKFAYFTALRAREVPFFAKWTRINEKYVTFCLQYCQLWQGGFTIRAIYAKKGTSLAR
jgi:hypothetical protein